MDKIKTEPVRCGWLLEMIVISSKNLLHSYDGISWQPSEKPGVSFEILLDIWSSLWTKMKTEPVRMWVAVG